MAGMSGGIDGAIFADVANSNCRVAGRDIAFARLPTTFVHIRSHRANQQAGIREACKVGGAFTSPDKVSPGKNVIRTRAELQARLDAMLATLHQLKLDGAQQQSMWEAFELFTDISVGACIHEADRAWWCEQVYATAEYYGLVDNLWLHTPDTL
ncbi:hypothetical protein [Luteibacter sp. dw_328]|uniref:hypothetical protein n=1 Tax=Luteibacter sp. dw_328 TaxID=2719796 RepID=UPI001BD3CE9B|nr:hypothetical protein [Luteibacter sp. dw_328]